MRAYLLIACFLLLGTAPLAADTWQSRLVKAATAQTAVTDRYDGGYVSIDYPMGDVPAHTGVCSDVIIRAYRALGVDLQVLVHKDMAAHFSAYPRLWGLSRTDRNIDHRRVPNLQTFFKRAGAEKPVTTNAADYLPGDIVSWNLRRDGGSLPHIGIVTDKIASDGITRLIAHNIGSGVKVEDILFAYPITGHYRYAPRP